MFDRDIWIVWWIPSEWNPQPMHRPAIFSKELNKHDAILLGNILFCILESSTREKVNELIKRLSHSYLLSCYPFTKRIKQPQQ